MRECSAVAVLVEVSRDVNAYTQRSFEENIVSKLRRNSIQTAVRSVDLKPRIPHTHTHSGVFIIILTRAERR